MADLGRDPQAFSRSLARLKTAAGGITGGGSPPVRAAGLVLVTAIKLELSKPGTGRRYRRGKRVHVASAPGQPPAVDRGTYRNSIGMEVVGNVLRVGSGDKKEKVLSLEFGNVGEGGFIEPRPAFRPALAACKTRMTGVVVQDLRGRPLK